jgi:hypothetical protein
VNSRTTSATPLRARHVDRAPGDRVAQGEARIADFLHYGYLPGRAVQHAPASWLARALTVPARPDTQSGVGRAALL